MRVPSHSLSTPHLRVPPQVWSHVQCCCQSVQGPVTKFQARPRAHASSAEFPHRVRVPFRCELQIKRVLFQQCCCSQATSPKISCSCCFHFACLDRKGSRQGESPGIVVASFGKRCACTCGKSERSATVATQKQQQQQQVSRRERCTQSFAQFLKVPGHDTSSATHPAPGRQDMAFEEVF